MVESARREIAYFDEVGFDLVKISVKASSVPLMIEAYRQLAEVTDHPLHLGVTEAGPPPAGVVKATAGIAALLAEGIGDTIRYSLTADPVEEVKAGRALLESMGLRERKGIDLIACPSCGRAEVDVIDVANRAQEAFGDREIPLQVAVMGCVVNGPGEARDADIGIAAGNKRGHLFVQGTNVAVVPEDEMVEALVEWAEFIHEHGVERALGQGRPPGGQGGGRGRPGRAARRAGRRRQRQRAARRPDPQAHRRLNPRAGRPTRSRVPSAIRMATRAHAPGRRLPPLVPGRPGQGRAGRQRAGAGHHGHPPLRLRHLGAHAGRDGRPHQGVRRPQRLLPAVHPR